MKDLDRRLAAAVQVYWRVRNRQKKQGKGSRKDAGDRAAVTGGAHCDGFIDLVAAVLRENGLPDASIIRKKNIILPGYFRPTKEWDLVVIADKRLPAAIEFKSQVGPSFGNNYNNRTEEALGNALDLITAYREGAFRPSQRPWLGYFFLLEEAPGSTSPVDVDEPHFKVFPEFGDASYAKRYELLCLKLVRERLYDAACLVRSTKEGGVKGKYREPNEEVSFKNFFASPAAKVAAYAKVR